MRTSSARQLEFHYSESPTQASAFAQIALDDINGEASAGPSTSFTVPEFHPQGQVYAESTRMAGRINALAVSEEEQTRLLRERQRLLDKRLSGQITKKETIRLEYVRWSLDRIEDAKYGAALDVLETAVGGYERLLEEIREINTQFQQHTGRRG